MSSNTLLADMVAETCSFDTPLSQSPAEAEARIIIVILVNFLLHGHVHI